MKSSVVLALFCTIWAGPALASGCPAGKIGPTPFKPITETKGNLTVNTYHVMDLSREEIAAPGWKFRVRAITVPAGAMIALHSHDKRPETVTMKHGTLTIYEQNCTIGYGMTEGQVYQSGRNDAHWAVNETKDAAVMYVVDLVSKDTFPIR